MPSPTPPSPGEPGAPRPSRSHRLSRPDLAVEIVADIIKQKVDDAKQQKEEARRPPPKRTRAVVLMVSVPVLFGLTAWNLVHAHDRPTVFTAEQLDAGVRFRIYLAAQAVEAYRDSLGRLPPTLGAVGMEGEGLDYSTVDSTYTISGTVGATRYAYRRGDDPARFAAAYGVLAQKGAR